ncbi:unnamed protein product [Rhizophagus irregularis]|nr:unnamed protein product [Rhizophagus irregularis]
MYELGLCHNDREGVEKDYNKAFELFKQSTGRGFPGGMMMLLMLGYCYDEGFHKFPTTIISTVYNSDTKFR